MKTYPVPVPAEVFEQLARVSAGTGQSIMEVIRKQVLDFARLPDASVQAKEFWMAGWSSKTMCISVPWDILEPLAKLRRQSGWSLTQLACAALSVELQ